MQYCCGKVPAGAECSGLAMETCRSLLSSLTIFLRTGTSSSDEVSEDSSKVTVRSLMGDGSSTSNLCSSSASLANEEVSNKFTQFSVFMASGLSTGYTK